MPVLKFDTQLPSFAIFKKTFSYVTYTDITCISGYVTSVVKTLSSHIQGDSKPEISVFRIPKYIECKKYCTKNECKQVTSEYLLLIYCGIY